MSTRSRLLVKRSILWVALLLAAWALSSVALGASGQAAHPRHAHTKAHCHSRPKGKAKGKAKHRRAGCPARHRHGHRRAHHPTTTTTTTSRSSSSPSTTTSTTTLSTTSSTTTTLPSRLEIDENDQPYSLYAGHTQVAAGSLEFNVYNYGQDPHTFAIVHGIDLSGKRLAYAKVPAGQTQTPVTVGASLPPGTYTLFCTLPEHAGWGMRATLTVR